MKYEELVQLHDIYECNNDYIVEQCYDYTAEHTVSAVLLPVHLGSISFHAYGPQYYLKRKGVNNYMLIFVNDGQGTLCYRGKKIPLQKHHFFLLRCRDYHELYSDGMLQCYSFYCAGTVCEAYFDLCYENGFAVVRAANPDYVVRLFKKLIDAAKMLSKSYDFIQANLIIELFTELCVNVSNAKSTTEEIVHQAWVADAISYIETNYADRISIKVLAEKAHVSEAHFIRTFKRAVGLTPYDYILKVRINKAKRLLRTTELTVVAISERTGFSSPNHFSEKFRSLVGLTPAVYRRTAELWNE